MDEERDIDEIEPLLEEVWSVRGTDLLLTVGSPPLMRVSGQMQPIEGVRPLDGQSIERIVTRAMGPTLAERYRREHEIDFAVSWNTRARLRCNAFHQRGTCSMALRVIPYSIPDIEDLGLPDAVTRLVDRPMGLVVVTGPTGSGKSTTLAAMLDHVNRTRACHIVTVEDPIEFVHANKRAAVSQREVGVDTGSFDRALRSVLREDPDVLLVGEMRDLESIATTLTIAETGHLVFATLHTNDSSQAIDRIVDVFPSDRRDQIQVQLAATLEGVLYQRLLPRRDGGLVGAHELLLANSAVRNLIREGKSTQLRNVVSTHQSQGMQTLEWSLNRLVAEGIIDFETALQTSIHHEELDAPPVAGTLAQPTPIGKRAGPRGPWIADPDPPQMASI